MTQPRWHSPQAAAGLSPNSISSSTPSGTQDMEGSTRKYWLMKAEPDSRVVRGRDVKFSVDDFESVGSTPWEGVRNYEARNLMKEMLLGDKIIFYHSNCKNPGIAGFAEVSKEAYPDYTAWDSSHPYFDEKSDKDNPRWFMVDARFVSRARHFIPLSLLRYFADLPSAKPPETVSYVGEDGVNAIKIMPLITRGRLSVQTVSPECWDTIQMMANKGGWDDIAFGQKKATKGRRPVGKTRSRQTTMHSTGQDDEDGATGGNGAIKQPKEQVSRQADVTRGRKRKVSAFTSPGQDVAPRRKSARSKR